MDALAFVPGFYQHFKHDPRNGPHDHRYEALALARHTEDKSLLVLYRPLYENDWFAPVAFQARPLAMFMETVTKDGKTFPRFARIEDPALIEELKVVRDRMYGQP